MKFTAKLTLLILIFVLGWSITDQVQAYARFEEVCRRPALTPHSFVEVKKASEHLWIMRLFGKH